MTNRSIKVKIVKETSRKVTIKMMSLNRAMPVPREDFERRVKNGLYEVINLEEEEEEQEEGQEGEEEVAAEDDQDK